MRRWIPPSSSFAATAFCTSVRESCIRTRPRFFTHTAVDFDFEPWLEFLGQLWGDDTESIDTLQEILGLMLTAETRYQKAFLLFGPKRSGKGYDRARSRRAGRQTELRVADACQSRDEFPPCAADP
jgi:hypothetical protein